MEELGCRWEEGEVEGARVPAVKSSVVRKVQDPPRPTAAVVQTGNALPQMSRQPVYFGVIRAPQLQIRCLDQIGVCSCGWVPKCVHRAASKRSRNVLRVLEGVTFRGEHTIDIRHAESRFLEELAPACASPANRHHDSLCIFQRSPCLPELTRETWHRACLYA